LFAFAEKLPLSGAAFVNYELVALLIIGILIMMTGLGSMK
jgi:hypothetical protein